MYFVCFGLIFVSFDFFVSFLNFFFFERERKNRKLGGNRGEKEPKGFGDGQGYD